VNIIGITDGWRDCFVNFYDMGRSGEEGNKSGDFDSSQGICLEQAGIVDDSSDFIQNGSRKDHCMAVFEDGEQEGSGQARGPLVCTDKDCGVESNPHRWAL